MALSSLFANNAAWAPTPASALTAPTPFHVPDPSMRADAEPVDPMDLCGGTHELSRDAASYVAQYYVDALSEPTRLADSPLFRKPPVGVSQMDLLSRHMGIIWDTVRNPRGSDWNLNSDVLSRDLIRTKLIYKLLLMSRLGDEKDLSDIMVCIAGHGDFKNSIEIILSLGATVISRERSSVQRSFDDPEPYESSFDFKKYRDMGRLIVSPSHEHHPCPYDIVMWENPTRFIFDDFGVGRQGFMSPLLAVEAMATELTDDGLFVLQSDHREYVAHVDTDGGWSRIFHRPVHYGSYLSRSRHIQYSADLVIAQRTAAK